MGENSAISWTHHTFNPWLGCTKVSPACANCYAEAWAKRSGLVRWGDSAPRRKTSSAYWCQPVRWNQEAERMGTRKRVFCASLADVFEDKPQVAGWRLELFNLIYHTPSLDWLLLTKRPENIKRLVRHFEVDDLKDRLPSNAWLGTTVESDDYLHRIDDLIESAGEWCPVLFLSCEPLLGSLNLKANQRYQVEHGGYRPLIDDIQWVITGGESGAKHRSLNMDHVRQLRDQCAEHNVAFHFKQIGGRYPTANGCLLDGREYKEFPKAA